MQEVWKDIENYENLYQVSNFGNIRNVKSNKLLKQEITKGGYLRVTLTKCKQQKHFSVHRLVAYAFIENPNGFPCINHIDENPQNNCVDNLEYCTYSYNINYGSRNFKVQNHSKPVHQMDFAGNILATYISVNFAAKMLNIDASNIYKCCRGEISYAYEYKWKYANRA